MKLSIPAGTTSKRIAIFIQDSSSTTGAGLAGLVFNTSSLTCYQWIDTDGNAGGSAITLATATLGTFTSSGFKEKDATNMPGWYEFGVPNAAIAAGVKWACFHFKGATNMAPLPIEIEVTAVSNQDAVRGGMTALPNANAEAAGGLYTRGSGAGQITQSTNGQIDVDAKKINSVATSSVTTINANQGTTQPVNFTGTAGSALVKSDMVDVAGAAVATGSAQLGVNVVTNGDKTGYGLSAAAVQAVWDALTSALTTVGSIGKRLADDIDATISSRSTLGGTAQTGDSFARLGAPAGASVSADIAAINAKTTNLPGSPAAVGSAMTLTSGERTSVADALLDRDMASGADTGSASGATGRTVRQALRFLRNRFRISGATLTVYKEDDSTSSWTSAVTTTAGNPVSESDPA